ncbi:MULTISPECIES: hypothetical protein [unclassified Pseudonocardia]|uniref:hypothetical protein n=1 Tax=unclassified Pseudonocardia TaxID=2619320 RepID=UPI000A881ADA|nr:MULTISPECIES: hypothetical protein [unclassified Pseudonocardia]
MTERRPRHLRGATHRPVLLGIALLSVLASGCAGAPPPPAEEVPHGYVEGAEETAEAQTRLIVADPGSGAVTVLDLLTEQTTPAGTVPGPRALLGDGRFGYVTGADDSTRIIDSGAWKVDHGDHVHYYRTEIAEVGALPAPEPGAGPGAVPVTAESDGSTTVVSSDTGPSTVLDRAALERGEITAGPPVPAGTGAGVPLAGHVLVATSSPGSPTPDRVAVRDRTGAEVATITEPCPDLDGQAVTRRGAVFGCADGALLVSEDDGVFSGTRIPYPEPVDDDQRARAFASRPGSSTLAAPAGEQGAWSLDLGRRTWTRVATGPAVAVNTVGERGPLLALGRDGVLRAFDPADGRRQAQRPLLSAAAATGGDGQVRIEIDTGRAYINDPSGSTVHEIDHGDGLRVARTLQVPGRAGFMIETGR